MAHTKGHIKGFKNLFKPAKGITFTPFKAAYSLAKTAFRHPYLAAAAIASPKIYSKFKGKLPKRSKVNPWTKKGR